MQFESLRGSDLPMIAAWLSRPHVEQWWAEPSDLASIEENYRPLIDGSDATEGFVIVLDGRPIGFVQRYRIDDHPDWRASIQGALGRADGFGIDYLIGEPDLIHQGLGRRMISEFVDDSWKRYPTVDRAVVAVRRDNIASWKELEGSGFSRVWEGELDSKDPSDRGPSFIYVLIRPAG